MSELHGLLEELADESGGRGAAEVLAGARARAVWLRRQRQVRRGVVVVVVIGIVVVGSVLVVRPSRHRLSVSGSVRTPRQPTPTKPLGEILLPRGAVPAVLAAAGGRVWIAELGVRDAPGHLLGIDPTSGAVRSDTALAGNGPFAIAADTSAVWVRSQQNERATYLQEIDARTGRVIATKAMQRDGGLAVSPNAVWAIDGSGSLLRIDPNTVRVIATIPLPGGLYPPLFVSAGPQGLLLSNPYDGSVLLVDTTDNTVHEIARLSSPGHAADIAQLSDAAWVTPSLGSTVTPVRPSGSIGTPFDVGARITSIASDGHVLWLAAGGLIRIDTQNTEIEHIALPHGVTAISTVASDPTTGNTWVITNTTPPKLLRFDDHSPFTTSAVVVGPTRIPELAVAVPDGCPVQPVTAAPPGDPNTAVKQAALDYVHEDRFWAAADILAQYPVNRPGGSYGEIFAAQVPKCGAAVAAHSYVVELLNPLNTQSNSRESEVVISHFARGWRAWGYYH